MKKIPAFLAAVLLMTSSAVYAEGNIVFSGTVKNSGKQWVSAMAVKSGTDKETLEASDIGWITQSRIGADGSYSVSIPARYIVPEYNILSNLAIDKKIYVSSEKSCDTPYGTEEFPYATIQQALDNAEDGSTIILQDIIPMQSGSVLTCGREGIVITGKNPETGNITGGIDLTENSSAAFCFPVTLENMTIDTLECDQKDLSTSASRIFASGYKLVMGEGITMTNPIDLFGGGINVKYPVESTDVTLMSGSYRRIYGGGNFAQVKGDTHITVAGNINPGTSANDSSSAYYESKIYGGGNCSGADVLGNTYISFNDGTTAYILGGGREANVAGNTNINITGGRVMNVYGGTDDRQTMLSVNTNICMSGGIAESLFGGSDRMDLNGNTNVTVTGGQVLRRIYGGCYNNYVLSYGSSCGVIGTTCVTLGPKAQLLTKGDLSGSDYINVGVFASDRYSSRKENSDAVLIFIGNSYEQLKGKIGEQVSGSSFKSNHNHIVKATEGGTVACIGDGVIKITPDGGKNPIVNGIKYYKNEYTLPDTDTDISVTEIGFEDGISITAPSYSEGDSKAEITANLEIGEGFAASADDTLIAVVYDQTGSIIAMGMAEITESGDYKFNVNLDGNGGAHTVRLYAWDKKTLLPLTESCTLYL